MNRKQLLTLVSLCGLSVSSYASADAEAPTYDQATLAQVEAFYGLSEDAALSRLQKEGDAAIQARYVEERQLPSYGGMWFDSATLTLHVAASNEADFPAIRRLGATPVLVDHSLTELEAARKDITDALTLGVGTGTVRESYVDVQANAVVFGVTQDAMEPVSAFMATQDDVNVPVLLKTVPENIGFSTNLLAADGTQNHSWTVTYGGVHPCSVGANAEKVSGASYLAGFATAGHCNSTGNTIWTSGGTNLGLTDWSTFNIVTFTFANSEDGAWVETVSPWVPQPQVDGYTSGTLNVSGTWAGMLVAPVGNTACRYGSASGGPHCASVSALNVTACLANCDTTPIYIVGLTKINNICTNDGDSGGTIMTPSNQIQGTDTGGTPNSCPDSTGDYVYLQPIATTISRGTTALSHPIAMLTSHARSAPTLSISCPDMAESGEHTYQCDYASYDSQGVTTTSWTTNTGASSSTYYVSGTCLTGQTVNVTLAATNPYGTTYKYGSFVCPIGPIP
jgi:streptogrisin C